MNTLMDSPNSQTVNVAIPRPLLPGDVLQVNFTVDQPNNSIPVGANGADISEWNTVTDWPMLANEMAFLFLRATLGPTRFDNKFREYWSAANNAGIEWLGVYHLYIKEADPVAQAQNMWRVTGGNRGKLPPVLDIETRTGETVPPATWPAVAASIAALIEECERLFLVTPMIYTSTGMWRLFVGDRILAPLAAILPRVPLFVADYTPPLTLPLGFAKWAFHQRGKKPRTWATGDIDDDVCAGFSLA